MANNIQECRCGCGNVANTSRGWVRGHWNRGKKHESRLKPGDRSSFLEQEKQRKKAEREERKRLRAEKKKEALNPCACGCGEMVKGKWKWGHHSRVNNISKRADIREKRSISMTRRHVEGQMPDPWNRGKTREDDPRIEKYIVPLLEKVRSPENRKMLSETMSRNRLNGTIPTLTGSSHSQWKGGTSSITQRVRGSHQLHKWWRVPIMRTDDFMCSSCETHCDLVVHHYEERMHEIIQKFLSEHWPEMTWDEETEVVDDTVAYHIKNDVKGVTMCKSCHDLVHEEEKRTGKRLKVYECYVVSSPEKTA